MSGLDVDDVVQYLRDPRNRRQLRNMVELYFGLFNDRSDREILAMLRDALNRLLEEI